MNQVIHNFVGISFCVKKNFMKKIVEKCDKNTLVLFHSIEYGQKILNKLEKG